MKTSRDGIDLICEFEGFGLPGKPGRAYQDSVGVWTIGFGHTSAAGLPAVHAGMVITEQEGRDILARDLAKFEAEVASRLSRTPTQNQFDALVSLIFNIGPGNFAKSSVLRLFNAGNIAGAGSAFGMWVKAGGKTLPGLVKRRAKEAALFLDDHPSAPVTPEKPAVEAIPLPPDIPSPEAEAPATGFWARLRSVFGGR